MKQYRRPLYSFDCRLLAEAHPWHIAKTADAVYTNCCNGDSTNDDDGPDLIDAARWTAVSRDPIVEERMTNALRKRLGAASIVASEASPVE